MNINDNKLNELISKTERLVEKKKHRRKMIVACSVGTFAVAAAVIIGSIFIGHNHVPDITVENSGSQSAADENAAPTPTPMPDGSTWNPNAGPTPKPNLNEAWDSWSETRTVGGVEVTVNTDIDSMKLYPVDSISASVYQIEPGEFDLSLAEKAVGYFLGDEYYAYGKTKADYELELQAAQSSYESMDLSDKEKAQVENFLDYLKSSIEIAPERLEKGILEFDNENVITLRGKNDGAIPQLYIKNEKGSLGSVLSYVRDNPDRDYLEVTPAYYVAFSEEEIAKCAAATTLACDAVNHFTDDMILSFENHGYVYDASTKLDTILNHFDYDTAEKCYIFYFTRNYGSTSADLDLSPLPYVEDMAVPAPSYEDIPRRHHNEYIKVVVDDLGIANFTWLNKTETVKIIQENADIINFDEAQDIFKAEIFNVDGEYDNQKYGLALPNKIELNVTEPLLEMVRIDSTDGGYLMVPAYAIKGTKTTSTHDGFEVLYGNATDYKNLLIINALDGSIIDLS